MIRRNRWNILLAGLALAMAGAARAAEADPMAEAQQAVVRFEWKHAYAAFTQAAAAEPAKSEQWALATFGAASAVAQIEPVEKEHADEAVRLYQQILTDAPNSKVVPRTLMNLGRLRELRDYPGDKPDLDGARELYVKVAQTWPNDPIADEATLRAASTLVQAYDAPNFDKVKQGTAMLEAWLKDHPNNPLAAIMWEYLGDTYFLPLGEDAKSVASFNHCDKMGWADPGNQGPQLWKAAVLSERIHNVPSAIHYYTEIIEKTPTSGKAYESQLALKRLGAPVPPISIFRHAVPTQPTQPTTREAGR